MVVCKSKSIYIETYTFLEKRNMAIEIISRQLAADKAKKRFYTGVPCKRGHLSERWTKTGNCIACTKIHYGNALNPIAPQDLVAASFTRLYVPRVYTREKMIELRYKLQTFIWQEMQERHPEHINPHIAFAIHYHETHKVNPHNPDEVP